jgi:arginyl-tRNA synthetase
MVELPEGKMKSREGTVVDADDLLDEMFATAESMTKELGKANELNREEASRLFSMIGLGALKYFILKVDPKKNMLFDPAESIDFNGNTGPFVQYTHARIRSLLARAKQQGFSAGNPDFSAELTLLKQEKEIVSRLYQFPVILADAAKGLSPAVIANYVYDLAKSFNQFYQEIPVLKEPDEATLTMRLAICMMTAHVIRINMQLLGIEVPERM